MSEAVWVLIPVKDFARGKSRLVDVLGAAERTAFAKNLFNHVLAATSQCAELAGTMVVTDSVDVAEVARAAGVVAISDAPNVALGGIVDAALQTLVTRGATRAVVLMSDLPDLTADDIRALLSELDTHDVVVAPDLRDEGTNALALDLLRTAHMKTAFGGGPSAQRHREIASAHRLRVSVCRRPGLALDIDVPSDLALLSAHPHAAADHRAIPPPVER